MIPRVSTPREDATTTISELTELTLKFRSDRDWAQFHTPKELALCLTLEAAEVAELMLWKQGGELLEHLEKRKRDLADELSDVVHAVLLLAHDQGIDLASAYKDKMRRNAEKYPVEKAKGKSSKYNEL